MKKGIFSLCFAQNIDCVYPIEPPESTIKGTHNPCFNKDMKIVYIPVNPSFTIMWGSRGLNYIGLLE